jgi:hypothetical protein
MRSGLGVFAFKLALGFIPVPLPGSELAWRLGFADVHKISSLLVELYHTAAAVTDTAGGIK